MHYFKMVLWYFDWYYLLLSEDHNHGQRLETIEVMLNVPSDSDEQAGDEQPHDADDTTDTSHGM